jgi:hypothetical protein
MFIKKLLLMITAVTFILSSNLTSQASGNEETGESSEAVK